MWRELTVYDAIKHQQKDFHLDASFRIKHFPSSKEEKENTFWLQTKTKDAVAPQRDIKSMIITSDSKGFWPSSCNKVLHLSNSCIKSAINYAAAEIFKLIKVYIFQQASTIENLILN